MLLARRLALLALPLTLPLSLLGCHDGPSATEQPPAEHASLRVLNAGAEPVDVIVDGVSRTIAVPSSALSATMEVGVGHHSVRLVQTGDDTRAATIAFDAAAGRTVTAIALNAGDGVGATVLGDTGAAPVPGKSKLRVIHLATNAPPLDVWRTQPDYGTAIRVMFPFPVGANSGYIMSTPGAWEVWVTPEGQTSPTLATTGGIDIGDGEVRTIAVLDGENGQLVIRVLDAR